MRFHEPVHFRLQMDQAIPAEAVRIFLVHKSPLLLRNCNAKALALRNVSRLTGKFTATTRAFAGFMVTHGRRVCDRGSGLGGSIRNLHKPKLSFKPPKPLPKLLKSTQN